MKLFKFLSCLTCALLLLSCTKDTDKKNTEDLAKIPGHENVDFMHKHKFDDLIKSLEKKVKENPTDKWLLYQLGQSYLHLKDYVNAQKSLEKAYNIDKNDVHIAYNLATLYVRNNSADKALQILGTLKKYDRDAKFLEANIYFREKKNPKKALEIFKQILRTDPKDSETRYLLATTYLTEFNNIDDALRNLKLLIKHDPLFQDIENVKQEISYLESLKRTGIKGKFKDYHSFISEANLKFDEKKYLEAITLYNKALAINSYDTNARVDMAICYRRIEDPDRAISELKKVIRTDPKHANALYNLGVIYLYDKNDRKNAKKYWDQLIKHDPYTAGKYDIKEKLANFSGKNPHVRAH